MHNLDTTGWSEFPFEAGGIKFVSKLSPDSPFQKRVKALPAGMFEAMNASAIHELVGVDISKEEIIEKLLDVNEFASHAVIELV